MINNYFSLLGNKKIWSRKTTYKQNNHAKRFARKSCSLLPVFIGYLLWMSRNFGLFMALKESSNDHNEKDSRSWEQQNSQLISYNSYLRSFVVGRTVIIFSSPIYYFQQRISGIINSLNNTWDWLSLETKALICRSCYLELVSVNTNSTLFNLF